MTSTNYAIRDASGRLQAIHVRRDRPEGIKELSWRGPSGAHGLGGRRSDSLPLYGSERVAAWPRDAWIVVCEGESDTDALLRLEVPALGTVTGAAGAPTPDAIRDVAADRRFVLWPDADDDGWSHMARVGANLYRAGARAVRTIAYRPKDATWPKGAGARDLVGHADAAWGASVVSWLIEEWSLPVDRPTAPIITITAPRPRSADWDPGSVSDALIAAGVLNARPGRTVRCPRHEDRSASLSILRDDKRAICKSASCEWSGRGVIAADVAGVVA